MDDSLFDRLRAIPPDVLPMHMPGHKRRAGLADYLDGLGAALDITEIEDFDTLRRPRGILLEMMQRAARLYGAAASFPLVNGSTAGILAGVRALTGPGDGVILQRGSHLSVYHALALCGLRPYYLYPPLAGDAGIPGSLSPEALSRALASCPGARLLILTCPSYEGVMSDLEGLVAIAHAANLRVLVDAAHGAHLGLHPLFPAGAVASGADIVVHGLHKTLPSLTQTALVHAGDAATGEALARQLEVFQTSSPSYLLLASIDGCLRLLAERGDALFPAWGAALDGFYRLCGGLLRLAVQMETDPLIWGRDRSKLLISCAAADITGTGLMARLRAEHGIELEMAGPRYALALSGLGDEAAGLVRLAEALITIDRSLAGRTPLPPSPLPEARIVLTPGEAERAPSLLVPVHQSPGRISAEYVCPYPPGIPLLVPGEAISKALAAQLGGEGLPGAGGSREPGLIAVLR
ncbi:MAG: aminotransferase class I/II-fold pyridoxal phosphate-dependent enzyme [Christensenellales bacterium]